MPSFRLQNTGGSPLAGATPAFVKYCDRAGVARTQPAIVDQGDGLYSFLSPAADVSDGVGFLIDCGGLSNPPRIAGFVGNGHVFFAGYNSLGAFLAGLTPTITTYKEPGGLNIVPIPSIQDLGSGLYAFTPTLGDRILGVRFAIDMGSGSGDNRYPNGDLGDGLGNAPAPSPTPNTDFSVSENDLSNIKRDLGYDYKTRKFNRLNGGLVFKTSLEAIAQAVHIRLATLRGEWFLDILNGIPYLDQILIKAPNLQVIEQLLRREIESVPGVKSVKTMTLNHDRSARKLSVKFIADTDFGELAPPAQNLSI